MKQAFLVCATALVVTSIFGGTLLSQELTKMSDTSPIYGVIPDGYRGWELIAPTQGEPLDELRAVLSNSW